MGQNLFWGIGPAFVMYLLLRDWWHQGYWPLSKKIKDDDHHDYV